MKKIKDIFKELFNKKEKTYTILRKNVPKKVLIKKVKDLNKENCSKLFLKNNFKPNHKVYVILNNNGEIDYRKKSRNRKEYRLLSISDHEIIKN